MSKLVRAFSIFWFFLCVAILITMFMINAGYAFSALAETVMLVIGAMVICGLIRFLYRKAHPRLR